MKRLGWLTLFLLLAPSKAEAPTIEGVVIEAITPQVVTEQVATEVIVPQVESRIIMPSWSVEQRKQVVIEDYYTMTVEVTAYTLGYESTQKTPDHPEYGITASGIKVKETDKVIAAPPHIPFGTEIEVPGYGRAPVLDRGEAIRYREESGLYRIDLLFSTVEEALEWGIKVLEVKIFTKIRYEDVFLVE